MREIIITKKIACIYSKELCETASAFAGAIYTNHNWKNHPQINFEYLDWTNILSLQSGVISQDYQSKIDKELLEETDIIIAFIRLDIGDGLKHEIKKILNIKRENGLKKPFFRIYFEDSKIDSKTIDCKKLQRFCELKKFLQEDKQVDIFEYQNPFIQTQSINLFDHLVTNLKDEIETVKKKQDELKQNRKSIFSILGGNINE